jgi:hypothetical protein
LGRRFRTIRPAARANHFTLRLQNAFQSLLFIARIRALAILAVFELTAALGYLRGHVPVRLVLPFRFG